MTELATTSRDHCPDCGGVVIAEGHDQPALFFHGGYGATERTTYRRCADCGWSLTTEVGATRPLIP